MRCHGKISYATHELATAALLRFRSQAPSKPGRVFPVRVYYCHDCGRYHLTSQPKRALIKQTASDFLMLLLKNCGDLKDGKL